MPESSAEVIKHLFFSTYDSLFEYAYSVLLDEKLADQAVQTVFSTAAQDYPTLQENRDLLAFLLSILKEYLQKAKIKE